MNYSFKFVVCQAKQEDQTEVNAFLVGLLETMKCPRQLIYVDETARGENASRRRRAWSPSGVTPIVEAPFVREFGK